MRQQKRTLCLGLMALLVLLIPGASSAGIPPHQTGASEKNQPAALPAAKEELLVELRPHVGKRDKDRWVKFLEGKEPLKIEPVSECAVPTVRRETQHVVYSAKRGEHVSVVLVDGQSGPEFDQVSNVVVSPDSVHVAYSGKRLSNKYVVVVDGQEGPEFDRVAFERDEFRPSGDDSLGGPASAVIEFSPNGHRVAYLARRGKKRLVFADGQEGPEFPFILTGPVFSADSQHLAYAAWEQNTITVVLDGVQIRKLSVPEGDPRYTRPGKEVDRGRSTTWDERFAPLGPLGLPPLLVAGSVEDLLTKSMNFVEYMTFSLDGQRLAYVVGHGGRWFANLESSHGGYRVVVDGQEGLQYDAESIRNLAFSCDSRHLAFTVGNIAGKGKSLVVVDEREGKPYDHVLADSLRFAGQDSVTYQALEGRKFYRVTQPLP
jgi:hypothetical protein